ALTTTTSPDARSVSLIAASACGLEPSLQKALAPPLLERASSAATGSSTSTERYMPSRPFPSALAPRPRTFVARRPRSGRAEGLLASGDPQRLLDLGDDARFRFEELLGLRLPAAQRFDREQAGGGGEAARHSGDHRPIAVGRPDFLRGLREQVVDELLRLRGARTRAHHRDGVLDQDRGRRRDVFDRRALLLIGDRLVLVSDQRVAPAGEERL